MGIHCLFVFCFFCSREGSVTLIGEQGMVSTSHSFLKTTVLGVNIIINRFFFIFFFNIFRVGGSPESQIQI